MFASLIVTRLECTKATIVSIAAVPGYTLNAQVAQINNQSIALPANESAPIPLLTPEPPPTSYPITSVPAGVNATMNGSLLELCAPSAVHALVRSCLRMLITLENVRIIYNVRHTFCL